MASTYLKYGIGIDVAKDKFDACIMAIDTSQRVVIKATRKFNNTKKGFSAFIQWTDRHCKQAIPVVYLMEATGVYHEQLAWYLHHEQKQVSIILPNKAKRYMQSLGLKSKTDRIDATGLARMCCEQHLRAWQPISRELYTLRLVTRQIRRFTEQATQLRNQIHALEKGMYRDKETERMLKQLLSRLEKQKQKLEERVLALLDKDPALKERIENIAQIKGLGTMSVAVIVAETNGFALIENQAQLVSYAGYDVVEKQSGKQSGKTRISKRGNSHIRRALHFPAFNTVKYRQRPFAQLYERVYGRTHIKMKAYTAVQKKLLVIIYTLWKKNEAFDPNYHQVSSGVERVPSFV